jgi:hypothetical protein
VDAIASAEDSPRFRNRKGISQNFLRPATLTFQYVLAGWEGSACDGRVVEDALGKGFPRQEGKYHLGDTAYALSSWLLTWNEISP